MLPGCGSLPDLLALEVIDAVARPEGGAHTDAEAIIAAAGV
jgi:hypothetical protein